MPHPILSTHVGNHKLEIPAKPISQCNQSSPTSVITRNIGHSQTIIKPKIPSFWLSFAESPKNRIKKQFFNVATADTNSSSPLSYAHYSTIAKTFCASLLYWEQAFAMIPWVRQPINHEYAHFYFAISKTTAKTNDSRKVQYSNQCRR